MDAREARDEEGDAGAALAVAAIAVGGDAEEFARRR
jgi:hypothetical protein